MATITTGVELARRPDDVLAYLDELERHREWQERLISTHKQGDEPTRVGTRCTEVRRLGRSKQIITYEVTELDPPRAFGRATLEPLGEGASARVLLELDFEGHGSGKLLAPIARSQARKQAPRYQKSG